jgi:hypothetical protein
VKSRAVAFGQFFSPRYELSCLSSTSRVILQALAAFLSKGVPVGVADDLRVVVPTTWNL